MTAPWWWRCLALRAVKVLRGRKALTPRFQVRRAQPVLKVPQAHKARRARKGLSAHKVHKVISGRKALRAHRAVKVPKARLARKAHKVT